MVRERERHKTPGSQSPKYREQDVILYFTDGVNEPRKVDIYKSHANKEALLSRSNFNINDYICVLVPRCRWAMLTLNLSQTLRSS